MKIYVLICCSILHLSCSSEKIIFEEEENVKETELDVPNENPETEDTTPNPKDSYKILALGDSYTIGESVCETCRFPEQLKTSLISEPTLNNAFDLKIIARTGWTTSNLLNAVAAEKLANNHDLVTLLIGVNNQYQGRPFSIYESEFPKLVDVAISKAKNNKSNVIVISIPDYAFTAFGNGNKNISKEIDAYNTFAEDHCIANNITYINITDITRMGLANPALVASDGLHPSQLAYSKFVERILPLAIQKLKP
tara:strand:+ start:18922 stop:19680 length:759 start_codon:yes stop_codon:yes gene_type:complete